MDLSSIQKALAVIREEGEVSVDCILPYTSRARWLLTNPSSPQEIELLLPCLRLIRDSLALHPHATTIALMSPRGWMDEEGSACWLAASVEALTSCKGQDEQNLPVLTALSQLLANLASNSNQVDHGAESIWSLFFPSVVNMLISHPLPKVSEPGTVALYKLTSANETLSLELCSSSGMQTWSILLSRSLEEEGVSEWLPLLVSCISVRQGLLGQLIGCLEGSEEGEQGRWSRYHPTVLHVLASELQEMQGTVPDHHSQHFLYKLSDLTYEAMLGCRSAELCDEKEERSCLDLSRHVLEASLSSLRGLLSRDDQGVSLLSCDPALVFIDPSTSHPNFIQILFCALAALGPPTKPQKNLHQENHQNGPAGSSMQCEQVTSSEPSPLSSIVSLLPHSHPYTGYRGDLLALIANLVVDRPEVAGQVCSLPLLPALPPSQPSSGSTEHLKAPLIGSVELLLYQAQLDDKSPVAREWALFAIRNLCLISEEARERIEGLEMSSDGADEVIETEDMRKMGMRLERDRETGKMKLKTSKAS
jgi:hypothetical protein